MSARTHFVYRAFDVDGRLLYIGCTKAPEQRRNAHRVNASWFPYAARFTMAGPFPEDEALRREDEAIEREEPWFNTTRTDRGNFTRWRNAYHRIWDARSKRYGDEWDRLGVDRRSAICQRETVKKLGPLREGEFRHAAYLAAREAGAMHRSAA